MSSVPIRCPNCAGAEPIPIGDKQYKCKYCEVVFNSENSIVTTDTQVQERICCSICGKNITMESGNSCIGCQTNNLCTNCISESPEKKLWCTNCRSAALMGNCMNCGQHPIWTCYSCLELNKKDQSHIITSFCAGHFNSLRSYTKHSEVFVCKNCGLVCESCSIRKSKWSKKEKCKNCGKKIKKSRISDPLVHKNQNPHFVNWLNSF